MKFLMVFFVIVFGVISVHANEPCADINGDGQVNITDFLILTNQYGQVTECAAQKPSVVMIQASGPASMIWNLNDSGSYIDELQLLMYDIDLSNVHKMRAQGYVITNLFVKTPPLSMQVPEFFNMERYVISGNWLNTYVQIASDWQFLYHLKINGIPENTQVTKNTLPFTLNFVMIHSANIIKSGNNSTD